MSTSKHFNKICIIIIILAMLGTVLFMNGEAFGLTRVIDNDSEYHSDDAWFTENDQDAGWDTSGATVIGLEGEDASVSGRGAYAYDGSVYISSAGKYVVSGTLTDGSIVVDAADSSKVWILLNGVEISCQDDACIRVDQADKVFLTLAEGTENTLSSGAEYSEEALADGTGGVIFSHDDLTINGSGSLTVTAAYKHGIEANDDMVITGGTITIEAPGDGIHVNDSLRMMETALTITAADDGIDIDGAGTEETAAAVSVNTEAAAANVTAETGAAAETNAAGTEDTAAGSAAVSNASQNGYLHIESGTYTISSEGDAIHTAGDITITGGAFTISSGDDGIHSEAAFDMIAGSVLIEECYEGIEAKTINVAGGDVTVYSTDDGLNANGNSGMGMGMGNMAAGMAGRKGGEPQAWGGQNTTEMPEMPQSGENGEMPEPPQSGENGEMPQPPQFEQSESAAEAADSTVTEAESAPADRNAEQTAGDDTAAANEIAADNTAMSNEIAGDNTTVASEAAEEESWICISGGSVTVINKNGRDADGIDSNGDIYITGGTVHVSVEGSNGTNSAVDYASENGGVFEVTGGTIVACGGSSMAEGFDSGSTQVGILYNLDSTVEAGTEVQLLNETGEVLLTYTAECAFNSVALSCSELQVGETYTIVAGEFTEEVTPDSTAVTVGTAGMGMGGGQQGGMGGMQQEDMGGMQPGNIDSMRPGGMNNTQEEGAVEAMEGGQMLQMPEGGEIPEGGEMPEMPQMPEGGQMPEMQNGTGMQGGPRQHGGGMPEEGIQPGAAGENRDSFVPREGNTMQEGNAAQAGNAMQESGAVQESESTETGLTAAEEKADRQYIGICIAVLAAAILFAALYRRHK